MPASNSSPSSAMRRRVLRLVMILLGAIAAVGGYLAVGFWDLNEWLDEGAHRLAPMLVPLIEEGRLAPGQEPVDTEPIADGAAWESLDAMILATQTVDRRVRHLSRGEPRHDPLWRTWYVKVFMETELVTEPGLTRSISFALRYRREGANFIHLGTETLGI